MLNIRSGIFETNSSSDHSIVIDSKGFRTGKDYEFEGEPKFGWNDFKLETEEAKLQYYAGQLWEAFKNNIPQPAIRLAAIRQIIGDDAGLDYEKLWKAYEEDEFDIEIFIDHQSVWNIPWTLPIEFFVDLKNFVLRDDVIIFGGNDNGGWISSIWEEIVEDNEEEKHQDYYNEVVKIFENGDKTVKWDSELCFGEGWEHHIARKDKGYWILYNRKNGLKKRISFNYNPKRYTEPASPENIVIAVNKAGADCNATENFVKSVLWQANRSKAFKVIIDGDEVLDWPYLQNFTKYLHKSKTWGANLGISTSDKAIVEFEPYLDMVQRCFDSVYFKIKSLKDIENLIKVAVALNGKKKAWGNLFQKRWDYHLEDYIGFDVWAYIPFGFCDYEEFVKILTKLKDERIPVYLTESKDNFGLKNYSDREIQNIQEILKNCHFEVDPICYKYHPEVFSTIKRWILNAEDLDGKFTLYVDGINESGYFDYIKGDPMLLNTESNRAKTFYKTDEMSENV